MEGECNKCGEYMVIVNSEELEFMTRVCKRSIEFASMLRQKAQIFDPEMGETIEKATILYNKLKRAYENRI